jgi:hypothetical protein
MLLVTRAGLWCVGECCDRPGRTAGQASPPRAQVERLGAVGQTRVYVIRNAKLLPKWKKIDRKVIDIAGRSTSSMIRTQGIGDLYREYLGSIVFGFDYNLAYIPDSFDAEPKTVHLPR